MARRGPIPLYTDDLANEVLGGLAVGMTARDAVAAAGVSEDTLERWRQGKSGAPADFAERYARAKLRGVRVRLRRLAQLADAGDVRAIEAWLDRCAPAYRKTTHHEISGPNGGPITHDHRHEIAYAGFLRNLSDDDLAHERRMAELRAAYQRGERAG